jgi:hypothetical protein
LCCCCCFIISPCFSPLFSSFFLLSLE